MYTVSGVKTLDVQVHDEEAPNADEEVLVGVGLPHITLLPLKCLYPLHVCIFSVEPTKSRTELEQNIILCPSRFILAGRYKNLVFRFIKL